MHKQGVREHTRVGPDGTPHKVRRHVRTVAGAARKARADWGLGFKPVTPARASAGALVGSAAYWTFSGSMSFIACLGWAVSTACAALMGYDAVKKSVKKRRTMPRGKRSVNALRVKVKYSQAKHRARAKVTKMKKWGLRSKERHDKWMKHVRKMPLGKRFNPKHRVKHWWRFRMAETKKNIRTRVDNWLAKLHDKRHGLG